MAEKIEIRNGNNDGIDEIVMPGVHLEALDDDHVSLALDHDGEHVLVDITAEENEDGEPVLHVEVSDRWTD